MKIVKKEKVIAVVPFDLAALDMSDGIVPGKYNNVRARIDFDYIVELENALQSMFPNKVFDAFIDLESSEGVGYDTTLIVGFYSADSPTDEETEGEFEKIEMFHLYFEENEGEIISRWFLSQILSHFSIS